MRAFGQRSDTLVLDEPLYAQYLARSGADHPGREEVLAAGPIDLDDAVASLFVDLPGGRGVHYQKHMAHHLPPNDRWAWTERLCNCFLVRDPARTLASLHARVGSFTLAETGLPQLVALFERQRDRSGRVPPVIDARDVRSDPGRVLTALCEAIGIPFDEGMLSWPPGRRDTDGAWAPHWYDVVESSTEFAPPSQEVVELDPSLQGMLETCVRLYDVLAAHRL